MRRSKCSELDNFFDVGELLKTQPRAALGLPEGPAGSALLAVLQLQPRFFQLAFLSSGTMLNFFVNATQEQSLLGPLLRKTSDAVLGVAFQNMASPSALSTSSVLGAFTEMAGFTANPRLSGGFDVNAVVGKAVLGARNSGLLVTLTPLETNLSHESVRLLWEPVFAVLQKHHAWFAAAFAREKRFWRSVNPNLNMVVWTASGGAQNDRRVYRFGDEVENDARIDLQGGNRGCVV